MISTLLVADERMNDSEPEFYVNFSGFTKSAKSDSNSVDETKFWAEANRTHKNNCRQERQSEAPFDQPLDMSQIVVVLRIPPIEDCEQLRPSDIPRAICAQLYTRRSACLQATAARCVHTQLGVCTGGCR